MRVRLSYTVDEEDQEEVVHIPKALEMIEEIRTAFVNVDTRLAEVTEIILGFDDYHRQIKRAPPVAEPSGDTSAGIKVTQENGDSQ